MAAAGCLTEFLVGISHRMLQVGELAESMPRVLEFKVVNSLMWFEAVQLLVLSVGHQVERVVAMKMPWSS